MLEHVFVREISRYKIFCLLVLVLLTPPYPKYTSHIEHCHDLQVDISTNNFYKNVLSQVKWAAHYESIFMMSL